MARYLSSIDRIYEQEQQYRFAREMEDREARFHRFLDHNDLSSGETMMQMSPAGNIVAMRYAEKAGPKELCKWDYPNARKFCRRCLECREQYR